jgi:hypothetical protein
VGGKGGEWYSKLRKSRRPIHAAHYRDCNDSRKLPETENPGRSSSGLSSSARSFINTNYLPPAPASNFYLDFKLQASTSASCYSINAVPYLYPTWPRCGESGVNGVLQIGSRAGWPSCSPNPTSLFVWYIDAVSYLSRPARFAFVFMLRSRPPCTPITSNASVCEPSSQYSREASAISSVHDLSTCTSTTAEINVIQYTTLQHGILL